MATTHTVQKLLTVTGKFVVDQKGAWEHGDWEALLDGVTGMGLELTDECKRNLGNICEATKYFYHKLPATPPRKKAAARAKAKRSA